MRRRQERRGSSVHVRVLAWGLSTFVPLVASAQTVGDYVGDDGCSTAVVRGLTRQLVDEVNCLYPGTLETFDEGGQIDFASGAVNGALLSGAVDGLFAALAERPGSTMTITSALRSLPQQYLLYQWYQQGRCGIQIAASPGSSNHESGKAIDISETDAWRDALEAHHWNWYGSGDRVHYDYTGAGDNIASASVLAFQMLWNANHPNDQIAEDGDYGPQTAGKLDRAPADGFAIGTTCNPCEQGLHARFDGADAPPEVVAGAAADVVARFTNTGETTWVAGQVRLATDPPVALDHDVIQGDSAAFTLHWTAGAAGPATIALALVDAGGAPLPAGCDGAPDGSVTITVVDPPPDGGDPDAGEGDPDPGPGPGDPGWGGSGEGAAGAGGLSGCSAGGRPRTTIVWPFGLAILALGRLRARSQRQAR